MKRTLVTLFALAFVALIALPVAHAGATKGSWTGWITDEHCGAKGANADHKACAEKCIAGGGKLVFYNSADKGIYTIDKQDLAKQHLGHEVTIKGSAEGKAIAVEAIEMVASK